MTALMLSLRTSRPPRPPAVRPLLLVLALSLVVASGTHHAPTVAEPGTIEATLQERLAYSVAVDCPTSLDGEVGEDCGGVPAGGGTCPLVLAGDSSEPPLYYEVGPNPSCIDSHVGRIEEIIDQIIN